MGLKGSRDQPADLESEREALRRQRVEAANELAALKRTLSERVAEVQRRERELADAQARIEKREQKLDAADARGSRFKAIRLRRGREGESAYQSQADAADVRAAELAEQVAALERREQALDEATKALETRDVAVSQLASGLDQRAAELDEREAALAERESAAEGESVHQTQAPDELARIEAKLTELREAEQAFVRTRHELAARSDALTEQEAALAERERRLAAQETPPPSPDLEILEARIRRLEQTGRGRAAEAQTFSSGLRALQARGLRGNRDPDEPLH